MQPTRTGSPAPLVPALFLVVLLGLTVVLGCSRGGEDDGVATGAGETAAATDPADTDRLRTLGYLTDGPDASSPEVHNNLAMIHLQKQELLKAMDEFGKALVLDPENPNSHAGLAMVLARQGRYEDARRELETATRLAPDNLMALVSLGALETELGNLPAARARFREALDRDPTFLHATIALATSYTLDGNWKRARGMYLTALAEHPEDPFLLYNLGRTFAELGDSDGAVAKYRETLERDPTFWPARNNLGDILQKKGRLDEAIEAFEAVVEGDPDHVPARYNLATVLMRKGASEPGPAKDELLDRAVDLFRDVISKSADLEFAHNNLALAYHYRGDGRNSYLTYDRMTRLFPESPRPWLETARVVMRGGNREDAVRRLREAFRTGGPKILAEARAMQVFRVLDLDALYAEATQTD